MKAPGSAGNRWSFGAMDAMTKKVLIVEDNELNMKLFHDLLDAHGMDQGG